MTKKAPNPSPYRLTMLLILLSVTVVLGLALYQNWCAKMDQVTFESLVADSADPNTSYLWYDIRRVRLSNDEIASLYEIVNRQQDYRSYLLLMYIRSIDPGAFARIQPEVRSRVLVSALAMQTSLNDWGYLDEGGSYDGPATEALLETGTTAVQFLLPLLADTSSAPLMGSEESTMAVRYGYRRCDFAYRYIMILLKERPSFQANALSRDQDIERLRGRLSMDHRQE
jgi:hypothetical protein